MASAVKELSSAAFPDCVEAIIVVDISGDMPDLQKAGKVLVGHSHTVIVVVGMTTARDFDLTKLGFVHSGADVLRSSITTAGSAKASTVGSAIMLDIAPDSEADRAVLAAACSSPKAGRRGREALSDLLHQNTRILPESGTGAHTFNPAALLGRLQTVSCEVPAGKDRGLVQQHAAQSALWCEEAGPGGSGVATLKRCSGATQSHFTDWVKWLTAALVGIAIAAGSTMLTDLNDALRGLAGLDRAKDGPRDTGESERGEERRRKRVAARGKGQRSSTPRRARK